jgi:phage tail-like protein
LTNEFVTSAFQFVFNDEPSHNSFVCTDMRRWHAFGGHAPQCRKREAKMAEFTVNPNRHDPYKQFKFRVKWDGKYVAGISKMTALHRSTDVVEHREGGDPNLSRKSPGRTRFEPITLTRGVTHDADFEKWANKVWSIGQGLGAEVSLADFRKDIGIELLNEAGQVVLAYKVYRCWPSDYSALSALDADATGVAFESLTLENEGWERDQSVVEPKEPSVSH